jgi:hypothetical protein
LALDYSNGEFPIFEEKSEPMKRTFTLLFTAFTVSAMAQSGITWISGNNIASNSFSNMHPRIALDGMGDPMVIWGSMSDASVYFCNWNGASFNPPVALNPGWLNIATGSWMGPQIASHGDTVYVVVKQTPEADTASHLYLIRSFDGGNAWDNPIKIDNIGNHISRFPTVTTDALGNPIIGFMKFAADFSNAQWNVTRSFDFGNTYSTDVWASGWSGGTVCDCCPGAIVNSGNIVTMLYRDNNSNIRDTWTGLSTDGGLSFADGWNVDGNNWNIAVCPSTGPDGEIIGDSLYDVFTSAASGTYRTYRSVSSISSGAAQPAVALGGTIPNLNMQNYPRMSRYGNAMAIVWRQSVNSTEQLPIYFTNNIANGFPMMYDTVDLNYITNADVAVGNGKIFVVWEDDQSGTVKYRRGTYVTTTGVAENTASSFSIYPNPAKDMLTIDGMKDAQSIRLINSLGAVVKEIASANEARMTIDIKDLAKGSYLVEVLCGGKVTTQKLMIE